MTVDLVLNNMKAYLMNEIKDCSFAIDDGKISKIGRQVNMPSASEKMDLHNLLVLPGLIDAHVHLRDEGKKYKEDFYSGTAAAASGGFTTVLDMPNNDPTTMSTETLRNRMRIAEGRILVSVGFYSAFPKNKQETERIAKEGAIAFKLFMAEQIGGLNIDDDNALLESFKILSELKMLVAVHAEDKATLKKTENELKRTDCNDAGAFLKAHSESVEVKAVERLLKIDKQTHTQVHFCHLSTENGLKIICDAKKAGMSITCETTPHNLLLNIDYLKKIGILALTTPPVRERHHAEALWAGIGNGCIDILASDHAPHTLEEKKTMIVWDAKVGIAGLETTLSLLLTEVKRRRLSITDVVRLVSERPAQIFKLKDKGCLKEGYSADLTIVDLYREYKIDASKFQSKAKYSPFDGWLVEGKPVKTFVDGQLVMDDGKIVAKPGSAKIVRRN